MSDPQIHAVLFALVFSVLLVAIELGRATGSALVSHIRSSVIVYLLIIALGNTITTLLASATLAEQLPQTLRNGFGFAAIGVFGFEFILKNLNVTFSDKGVLTISDWITKARDSAVADVIKAGVEQQEAQAITVSKKLKNLSENELNTHLLIELGPAEFNALDAQLKQMPIDVLLYKAQAFAKLKYDKALALSKAVSS